MAKAKLIKLDDNDRPDRKHPDYDALKTKRVTVQTVMAGVDALLGDQDAYLPQYEGETDASYNIRTKTATLNNYTKKAVKVMTGMVFEKELDLSKVPEDIQTICENIDKEGSHINIFARNAFEQAVLADGYGAIVVDTPSTVVENKAEQAALDVNPYARFYCADSIWNWQYRTNPVTKAKELSLIVFQENTPEKKGRFGVETAQRYRVYELAGNKVTLQTWTVDGEDEPKPDGEPVTINTSAIPVNIVGNIEPPPLYDIAKKNIEHFQTYSLLKSDAHKTCVPQRVIEGGSPDSIAPIGGDVTLFPPQGMKAYFIEVQGSSLEFVRTMCKDIADDIALMTNSIIAGKAKTVQKTATEDVIDHAEETAELKPMAERFKDALERTLGFIAELMNKGKDAGGEIKLGANWNRLYLTAQDVTAEAALVTDGLQSLESFVERRASAGLLPEGVDAQDELKRIEKDDKRLTETEPVRNAKNQPSEKTNEAREVATV